MTLLNAIKLFTVLSTFVHLTMLFLFVRASRKHRHHSFLLLAIATVFTLLYTVGVAASYFMSLNEALALNLYQWGVLCAYVGLPIGFWGMLSLLRSYARLASAASPGEPGK